MDVEQLLFVELCGLLTYPNEKPMFYKAAAIAERLTRMLEERARLMRIPLL